MRFPGTSRFVVISVASVLAAVAGCAPSSRIEKTFEDPAYSDASFDMFMVIGIGESETGRRMFEEQLVASLREYGVDAIPSYAALGRGTPLARENIVAAVGEVGADAVLVTRLKSAETQAQVEQSREEVKVSRRDGRPVDLFRYDYEVLSAPEVVRVTTTVVLSTDLYSVAGKARIWSVDSTAFDAESVKEVIETEAGAIIGQLRRDGYLAR